MGGGRGVVGGGCRRVNLTLKDKPPFSETYLRLCMVQAIN